MKIIRIGAVWCPACLVMKNRWQKIENKLSHVEFTDYDLDMDSDKITYQVGNILPVCIIEENGKEVARIIGEKKEADLEEALRKVGVKL